MMEWLLYEHYSAHFTIPHATADLRSLVLTTATSQETVRIPGRTLCKPILAALGEAEKRAKEVLSVSTPFSMGAQSENRCH